MYILISGGNLQLNRNFVIALGHVRPIMVCLFAHQEWVPDIIKHYVGCVISTLRHGELDVLQCCGKEMEELTRTLLSV